MLPSKFRLKKETDFKRVYRRGRRIFGSFFDFFYLFRPGETRFGVVATAKSIKKASRRNRAKRCLRSLLLENKKFWPKRADLVIKIKREIKDGESVEQELKDFLKKLDEDDY